MGVLDRFDGGDGVAVALVFAVLTPWVGISNGTEYYGYSIVGPAVSGGGYSLAMSTVGIWVGTSVAYVTNQSLALDTIFSRPLWEKLAAAATMLVPVVVNNVGGLRSWMLDSYLNGTVVALLVMFGFTLVSYRRKNDKKLGFVETVSQVAEAS
jgi:hypothetical protein